MKLLLKQSLVASLVGLLAAPAFADVTLIPPPREYTAIATTVGEGKVEITDIKVLDINTWNERGDEEITWPPVTQAMIDANNWILSNQVIEIVTTITQLNGGVQMVTDNTAEDADPKFVDPTPATIDKPLLAHNPDSNPAGLVLNMPGQTKYTLPLAWTIKDSRLTTTGPLPGDVQIQPPDPNTGPVDGPGYRFQWLYIFDRATPVINWNGNDIVDPDDEVNGIRDSAGYVPGDDYQRIIDYRGRHLGGDADEFVGGPGKKTSYVYFQANFESAIFGTPGAPISYKTNKLVFEAFTE
jgi:hypothetical protein